MLLKNFPNKIIKLKIVNLTTNKLLKKLVSRLRERNFFGHRVVFQGYSLIYFPGQKKTLNNKFVRYKVRNIKAIVLVNWLTKFLIRIYLGKVEFKPAK